MKVYLCNTHYFYLVDSEMAEQYTEYSRLRFRVKGNYVYLVAQKVFKICCCRQSDLLFDGKECRTHVNMAFGRVNRQWALNVGITAGGRRCCLGYKPFCEVSFLLFVSFLVTFMQKTY